MTVFDILNLRSEYEEIVLNYKVPGDKKPGTLDNLQWFIDNGRAKNSRRKGFARAMEIANEIVNHEINRKKVKKRVK